MDSKAGGKEKYGNQIKSTLTPHITDSTYHMASPINFFCALVTGLNDVEVLLDGIHILCDLFLMPKK